MFLFCKILFSPFSVLGFNRTCNSAGAGDVGFVWEFGGEGRVLETRKEQVKEIKDTEMGGFWGFNFLQNTKSTSFEGAEKSYWRRVLEGLYEFKFNLNCYSILKIKNISIISINLSFSKKLLF